MEYDDLSVAQRELFHASASKQQERVWSHVVAVRVSSIVDNKEAKYHTGSGILLRLGDKHFVLTAWHVFAELLAARNRGEEAYFMVGNAALEPPNVVYADEDGDIVFLAIGENVLDVVDAEPYDPGQCWPPRRPTVDDVALLCGLPAYLRSESGETELVFGDFSIMQPIASVNERQFILQLDRGRWVDLGRTLLPREEVFLGGISGAPVFAATMWTLELVGIVSEIGETMPLLYGSCLYRVPTTF